MQGSSKPLMGVQFPQGVLNVGLDEVVKSPHFQCGDYGFESKYPYLNGLCSVIRLAQDICNVLEEFKSHKVHTMFSCFHNVELLFEPSFGQLEVKETALSMLLSSVV